MPVTRYVGFQVVKLQRFVALQPTRRAFAFAWLKQTVVRLVQVVQLVGEWTKVKRQKKKRIFFFHFF
jgi:hypothetical protein